MRYRSQLLLACGAVALAFLAGLASCGARTGLEFERAAPPRHDAGPDVTDTFEPEEAADVATDDGAIDNFMPDVPLFNPCPDAAATLIYVIGNSNTLYSFDPPTRAFTPIGTINCPGAGPSAPFSMAVDRQGVAYVEFAQIDPRTNMEIGENIYRVSTKTASCTPTKYDPRLNSNITFGMSFVANAATVADGGDGGPGDAGETLYIARDLTMGAPGGDDQLATLDTTTFSVSTIGLFTPTVSLAELTGTGKGDLFAFFQAGSTSGGTAVIGKIDRTTAKVVAEDILSGVTIQRGWAFGYWGGNFYLFNGSMTGPGSDVIEYDPVSKKHRTIATSNELIVGAGVSTCAPTAM